MEPVAVLVWAQSGKKPDRTRPSNTSFEQLGDLSDINKAISVFEKAVELTPDHNANKPSLWNNLGNSLSHHFEQFHNLNDIKGAILLLQKAVEHTPDDHAIKPERLNNLGQSLTRYFQQFGDFNDLNKAILVLKNAVDLTPNGHPSRPLWLWNLGCSLLAHFEKQGNNDDIDTAISYWSTAACSPASAGPTSVWFLACSQWAYYANFFPNYNAIEAYTIALNLLPQLAWLALSIQDQQFHLLAAGKVVRDAVSAAIDNKQFQTALEWLEQGHSVIWGQLLHLHTPLDDLKSESPELANQLEQLSKQLKSAGTQHVGTQISLGNMIPYHDLAYEREEVITSVWKSGA
jgi:tetratricopeptide (TPR) repeat protein